MSIPRALMLALLPLHLAAQASLTTVAGLSHLNGASAGGATSFAGSLAAAQGAFRFRADGALVEHEGFGQAGQGRVDVSYNHQQGSWSVQAGPLVRLGHEATAHLTTLLGGGAAVTWRSGLVALSGGLEQGVARLNRQQAGWGNRSISATILRDAFDIGVTWKHAAMSDSILRDNVFFDPHDPQSDTLFRQRVRTIEDLGVHARWSHQALSLNAQAGRRTGTLIHAETWWSAGAAMQITPSIALVGTVARTPADLLLGLRGGRTSMLGLRLSSLGRHTDHPPSARRAIVETRRESAGKLVRVILDLAAQARVELMGDATQWKSVPMTRRSDGRWEAVLAVPRGLYRFNIAIDGGSWTVPDGLASVADDFGGRGFLLDL